MTPPRRRRSTRLIEWFKRVKGPPTGAVGKAADLGSTGLSDGEVGNRDRPHTGTPDQDRATTPDSPPDQDIDLSRQLSSEHEAMLLKESGISRRVAMERGYRTVTTKVELERLGFGRSQCN